MIVDLHNHTPLCNHAEGSIDEYITAAIKKGTKFFGFSDHAPMDFDPAYRMKFEEMQQYEAAVSAAKERYKEQITVLLGYEVDYLANHMDKRVLHADVDYLIGSVHFLEGWGFDNPEFIGKWQEQNVDDVWQKYFDTIEAMAETKLFDIVGHLDLIKVFNFMPKGNIVTMAKRALEAIKENNMVLEVNVAGYRKPVKEPYPSQTLLTQAYKLEIPITLSSDAHKPQQVGLYSDEVMKMVREAGYTECVYFQKREQKSLSF
jgi:histidinol-phosphatase (PHP family)